MEVASLPFTKMHGCANDYVVVDGVRHSVPDPAALARACCDRRRGVGADGLLLALRGEREALRMRMFNPDGSEAEMCGNGLRCLVLFALERGLVDSACDLPVETAAGVLRATLLSAGARGASAQVEVAMGHPRLERAEIPMHGTPGRVIEETLDVDGVHHAVTAVSMGNPHAVIFVEDVEVVSLDVWGPALECHPAFPRRTNVEVVQVVARDEVYQRTWERGVGETQACGTGACAVAVAGVLAGRTEAQITVHLRGGDLQVHWDEAVGVRMTGPAVQVFSGLWPQG